MLAQRLGDDGWLWLSPMRPIGAIPIPMFFALSGFLVANSMMRSQSVSAFITLRVLRLMPALVCLTFVTAMIIGPVVTELPLGEYFRGTRFFTYWLNAIGDVRYFLPGVFHWPNRVGVVNISLWTIPWEIGCYGGILAMFVFGILRRPREVAFVCLLIWIVLTVQQSLDPVGFDEASRPSGRLLAICFFAGVLLYAFRHQVPLSRAWFLASLAASALFLSRADTAFLAPLPIAYVTVYFGLLDLPRIPVLMSGDYSYGIYLYAFPMQQLYMWLDPIGLTRFAPYHYEWYANIIFALPMTIVCAMLSWHFVEGPVMSRRKLVTERVRRFEERMIAGLIPIFTRRKAF